MLRVTTAASEYSYSIDGEETTATQAQDTTSELVKPTLSLWLLSPGLGSHLRAVSRALSKLSGRSSLRRQSFGVTSWMFTATPFPHDTQSPKENKESVKAHLLRELRWVSTMSTNSWSVPQVQKSKNWCATACPRACATSSARCSRTAHSVVLPPALGSPLSCATTKG